jgi:hypothetical protein
MSASLAPVDRSKLQWWLDLILVLVVLPVVVFFLVWQFAPSRAMRISELLSP